VIQEVGHVSPIYAGERKSHPPSVREYALLEEFSFVRREAQAEADLAYQHWRVQPSKDAYAVYRAAQDRADAAQDDLADWSRALAA
jgi:hypothetical protein